MKTKSGIMSRFKQFFLSDASSKDALSSRYYGFASDAGESVTHDLVLSISSVWACVNLIAGTIGTLPLMVFKTVDDDREKNTQHPLYRILHSSPNYDQTAVDFWEFMATSVELQGNAYAKKEFNNGNLVALWPIPAAQCVVKRLENGRIEYNWTENGKPYREDEANIFHIRGFGGSALGGFSTLHYGRNSFGLARAIDKAASSTFKNGLRPSAKLTFPKFLSAENREIASGVMSDQFAGAINAGKPIILEGGTTYEAISINPEDAQMLESRGFSVEEICRFFAVPPPLIGHSSKATSWPTGLQQQVLMFEKFTLRRRLRRIEMAIMQQLMTDEDRAGGVVIEFQIEGLLRGSTEERTSFYQSALASGWMTINEVRRLEDREKIEGGDVARIQMQNVPIHQPNEIIEPVKQIEAQFDTSKHDLERLFKGIQEGMMQ